MKILISGLPDSVQEDRLRAALEMFGEILEVKIFKEGSGPPWALVDFNLTRIEAITVADKINGIYHEGRTLGAHVRLHT